MHWSIDAIFTNGVFKPDRPPPLREDERVHLEVQSVNPADGGSPANGTAHSAPSPAMSVPLPAQRVLPTPEGRQRLIERLRRGGGYRFNGQLPTRDELHER